MVQELRKRERDAHRAEFGPWDDAHASRIAFAIERENQPDPDERERVIRLRAIDMLHESFERHVRGEAPA